MAGLALERLEFFTDRRHVVVLAARGDFSRSGHEFIEPLGEVGPVRPHLRLGIAARHFRFEGFLRLRGRHGQHLEVQPEIFGWPLAVQYHADRVRLLVKCLHDVSSIIDHVLVVRPSGEGGQCQDQGRQSDRNASHASSSHSMNRSGPWHRPDHSS